MPKLFVYGTLREGGCNGFYLNGSISIFKQCWIDGSLYDTGNGYPALVKDKSANHVFGELYDVTAAQLKKVDQLEGYVEKDPDNLYERAYVTVINDKGEKDEAFTYFGGKRLIDSDDRITTGDWNVHRYLKQANLLYFAYGSCMDNKRFTLQGVAHHFKHVFGHGLLEGYELQFSRDSNDGGKADIVENLYEKVEGKVYLVPFDAITYLYKREGVYRNVYRPIIIDCFINGVKKRAITFIGTEKEEETAPTVTYATEIIRGGTGFLNDHYVDKLQNKIDLLLRRT